MMKTLLPAVFIISAVLGHQSRDSDGYHPELRNTVPTKNLHELPKSFWIDNAHAALKSRLERERLPKNKNVAKNIIMFLGDGMSIPTLAAARTYLGQKNGNTGEENQLSFEKFPYVGLAKTYCVDKQVPDSACTATAYLCGVKNNYGTTGVSAEVTRRDCAKQADPQYHTESIANWAIKAGKQAGIVTTTRITHASPSGAYTHIANRNWENDGEVLADEGDPYVCPDIAHQLVHDFPGNELKVVLGGGRRNFIGTSVIDEEGSAGRRIDSRDLRDEWVQTKYAKNATGVYVWNREQLMNVNIESTDYLLGLFETNHLVYNLERDQVLEPALEDLTEVAIKILQKSDNGYFLFVEGGRIDHAHHDNRVHLALDETVEFDKAVMKALEMTEEEDTLIVVTSDHAHVMAFNGYSSRGKDVLGLSDDIGDDEVPYLTLSYTNGPGFRAHQDVGKRADVSALNYENIRFRYPSEVLLESETHGADDIAVFARGPWEHIFSGVYEQNEVPHLMAFAACIGPSAKFCIVEEIGEDENTEVEEGSEIEVDGDGETEVEGDEKENVIEESHEDQIGGEVSTELDEENLQEIEVGPSTPGSAAGVSITLITIPLAGLTLVLGS